MKPSRRDIVWAVDPFRQGSNPRPWLVVAASGLPHDDEECIGLALTTSGGSDGRVAVDSDDWEHGQPGRGSYVLPWTIATLKHRFLRGRQGALTGSFTDRVAERLAGYVAP